MVISTTLLIGESPMAFNLSFNHSGDSEIFTFSITAPIYLGHNASSSTSSSKPCSPSVFTKAVETFSNSDFKPLVERKACKSLATP